MLPVPALRRPHWMVPAGAAMVLLALMLAASYSLLGEPEGVFKPVAQSRQVQTQPIAAPVVITAVPAVEKAPEPVAENAPVPVPAPEALPVKPLEAPAPTVTYQLAIQPWGTVYVDGKQRGVSPPLKKLTLSAGKHTIKVVNPSFPDHVSSVTARAGKPGTIGHDFSAASN